MCRGPNEVGGGGGLLIGRVGGTGGAVDVVVETLVDTVPPEGLLVACGT